MQWRATLWITEAFQMSPTWGIKAITGLIPIYLHLDKIYSYQQLKMVSLPSNHVVKALLYCHHSNASNLHCLSLEKLSSKKKFKVKSSMINTNNCLNEILSSFNSLHKEPTPGFQLVDIFSNYFSFNIC